MHHSKFLHESLKFCTNNSNFTITQIFTQITKNFHASHSNFTRITPILQSLEFLHKSLKNFHASFKIFSLAAPYECRSGRKDCDYLCLEPQGGAICKCPLYRTAADRDEERCNGLERGKREGGREGGNWLPDPIPFHVLIPFHSRELSFSVLLLL